MTPTRWGNTGNRCRCDSPTHCPRFDVEVCARCSCCAATGDSAHDATTPGNMEGRRDACRSLVRAAVGPAAPPRTRARSARPESRWTPPAPPYPTALPSYNVHQRLKATRNMSSVCDTNWAPMMSIVTPARTPQTHRLPTKRLEPTLVIFWTTTHYVCLFPPLPWPPSRNINGISLEATTAKTGAARASAPRPKNAPWPGAGGARSDTAYTPRTPHSPKHILTANQTTKRTHNRARSPTPLPPTPRITHSTHDKGRPFSRRNAPAPPPHRVMSPRTPSQSLARPTVCRRAQGCRHA